MAVPDGLPMRLPPTDEQRQATLIRSGLAGGRSRSLRPIPRGSGVQVQPDDFDPDVITGSSEGANSTSISTTVTGTGASDASGNGAVAVGTDAAGSGAFAGGTDSTAVGGGAAATHDYGGAIGAETFAGGIGTWAIGVDSTGTGAAESNPDVIRLGTSLHTTVVIGALVISDGSNLWRLDATGGTLSLVAYP